jgi:hypothetical protein
MLFNAITNSAHTIKILSEIIYNNIKTICLEISEHGIKITAINSLNTILLNINLPAKNFNKYIYNPKEISYIGINASHLYKMLRSVKKKDTLRLFIENIHELGLEITAKDKERTCTSFIAIIQEQIKIVEIPKKYTNSTIIFTYEFSKAIKDLQYIGKTIRIHNTLGKINFESNINGLFKRVISFDSGEGGNYDQNFSTDFFSNIVKISGLSKTLHMYIKHDMPLKIKTNIGSLGKISIYIKPNNI